MITIQINDTYSHVENENGTCHLMRNGKFWRDVTGDSMMAIIIDELGAAQAAATRGKTIEMAPVSWQQLASARRLIDENRQVIFGLRRENRKMEAKLAKQPAIDNRNDRQAKLLRQESRRADGLRAKLKDTERLLESVRNENDRLRDALNQYRRF